MDSTYIFIGKYKGVSLYTKLGWYYCLFGWMPKRFNTIIGMKRGITAWSKS